MEISVTGQGTPSVKILNIAGRRVWRAVNCWALNFQFFVPKGLVNGHRQVGLTNMTTKFPSEDLTTKIKADFKKCPKNFLKDAEFGVQDKNILKSLRHVIRGIQLALSFEI